MTMFTPPPRARYTSCLMGLIKAMPSQITLIGTAAGKQRCSWSLLVITLVYFVISTQSLAAGTEVNWAKEPIFVDIPVQPLNNWLSANAPIYTTAQENVTAQLNNAAANHPARLITLRIPGLKLNYQELTILEQEYVTQLAGEVDSVETFYQESVSAFFAGALSRVENAPVSFVGVPLEAGRSLSMPAAQAGNENYRTLVGELDAFVSPKMLMYSDGNAPVSSVIVVRSLPLTVNVAQGRPIVFLTNHGWQMMFSTTTQAVPDQEGALIFHKLSQDLPLEFYDRIENEWGVMPISLITSWAIDPDHDGLWNPEATAHGQSPYHKGTAGHPKCHAGKHVEWSGSHKKLTESVTHASPDNVAMA